MLKHLVVLSGKSASGKSTLAKKLVEFYDGFHFETCEVTKRIDLSKYSIRKSSKQNVKDALDKKTEGKWVSNELEGALSSETRDVSLVILDSIRSDAQIRWLRKAYGSKVIHIHLEANAEELERRYRKRNKTALDNKNYEKIVKSKAEKIGQKI